MNIHADKTHKSKRSSMRARGSNVQSDSDSTSQIIDNNKETIVQRKLKEIINNSPQVQQAAQLQSMVESNHTTLRQLPAQKKENNTGLPDNLKTGIENISGYSMDDVKVHYNSSKPAQVQAYAYAQGTEIHLGPGQEKHLPHEAWHVVQQKQGRVNPTRQLKGKINVNDDATLESEANVMGAKALQVMPRDQFPKNSKLRTSPPLYQHKRPAISSSDYGTHHSVYQLQTRIFYAPPNNRLGSLVINSAAHKRVPHNNTQRNLASFQSGYFDRGQAHGVGANICNHYISYSAIAGAVLAALFTNDLDDAIDWVNNTYNANRLPNRVYNNGAFNFNFGAQPAANIPNLAVGGGPDQYDEYRVENEIDDIIYNLANDPQNLFYWPSSTGADPDVPFGNNNSPLAHNNVTVANLTARLDAYRNHLANTLGLVIP